MSITLNNKENPMSVQVKVTIEPTAGGTYKARLDVQGASPGDEHEVLHTDEFDTPEEARRVGDKLAAGIQARGEPH